MLIEIENKNIIIELSTLSSNFKSNDFIVSYLRLLDLLDLQKNSNFEIICICHTDKRQTGVNVITEWLLNNVLFFNDIDISESMHNFSVKRQEKIYDN